MGAAAPIALGVKLAADVGGAVAESKGLKAEARAMEENARLEQGNAAFAAVDAYRASRMEMGEDMVAFAASGGMTEIGSAADMLQAKAIERELEVLTIRFEGHNRAEGLRAQARDKRRAAKGALWGGILGATASAINGASALRSQSRTESQNEQRRQSQKSGYGMPIPTEGK